MLGVVDVAEVLQEPANLAGCGIAKLFRVYHHQTACIAGNSYWRVIAHQQYKPVFIAYVCVAMPEWPDKIRFVHHMAREFLVPFHAGIGAIAFKCFSHKVVSIIRGVSGNRYHSGPQWHP